MKSLKVKYVGPAHGLMTFLRNLIWSMLKGVKSL